MDELWIYWKFASLELFFADTDFGTQERGNRKKYVENRNEAYSLKFTILEKRISGAAFNPMLHEHWTSGQVYWKNIFLKKDLIKLKN